MDEADVSEIPPCERSAGTLKSHFQTAKSHFTNCVEMWERSDQSDPALFPNFLKRNHGILTTPSKRSYILLYVCRLGTPFADITLLDMCTKLIPSAEAGYEEGLPSHDAVIRLGDGSSLGSSGSRKRRRSDSQGDSIPLGEHMKAGAVPLAAAINDLESSRERSRSSRSVDFQNGPAAEIRPLKDEDELINLVAVAYERLQTAKKSSNQCIFP